MALNNLGLGFVFTAKDLASGVMSRVQHGFSRLEGKSVAASASFGTSLGQFGQGLAIMGAGLAGLAALDRAVQVAGDFSYAIAEVSTLVDEATFATDELSRVSLDLSSFYGGSAIGQARALYQTISAGVTDAAKATDLLRVANELAIGGVTDTRTAVDALTNVVNAYAATGAQARDVSDAFFVAIRAGKTTAAELAATIGRVAPTAVGLGVSFSDLLAAIASISVQGLNTAEAVTGMKAALSNIIKPTADAAKEAARLGIRFDAATVRARGLSGFLEMVTSAAGFNADSLSKLFGSVEALNAVTALTSNSSAKFHEILGQMADRTGATRLAFDKMADTLTFQQNRFKALKENVLIVIGQALEPVAKAIVRVANAILESFLSIPKPIRDFTTKIFAAASVLLVLFGGVIAAKAGIALLAIGFKALGITIGGILATLLPAILIVAVLGAVVAAFVVAFRRNVGGIADFARRVWERVTLFFNGLKQLFEQGGFSGAVREELNRAENQGLKRFLISLYQIVYRIQQIWEGFKAGFTRTIEEARPVFEDLVAAFSELGQEIAGIFSGFTGGAASLPSAEFRSFGEVAGSAIATVVKWLAKLVAIFARITGGIIAGFRSMMEYIGPAFEVVGEALGDLRNAWNTLTGSTSDSTSATDESTSSWRSLGEFLGQVFGGIVTVITLALGGLIKIITAVIWVVNAVKDAFVIAGT